MKTIAFAAALLLAGSAQAQNIFGNPWDAPRHTQMAPVNRVYQPPGPLYGQRQPQQVYRPAVNCYTVPFGGSLVTRCN
jgi:hypothetical protein